MGWGGRGEGAWGEVERWRGGKPYADGQVGERGGGGRELGGGRGRRWRGGKPYADGPG